MEPKHYITGDAKTDRIIEGLAKKYGLTRNRAFIRELLTSVIKMSLDKADDKDLYLANLALKELRHIFRTFAPYRDCRKVVIFGSHFTPPSRQEYKLAVEFAKQITKANFMVITGGGSGVMEAGNLGAGKRSFAVKINIPMEENANRYVSRVEKFINVQYFFTRKLAFIKESDATILFPGGFGTHDEGFEVLTLLRTGKTPPRPVVFLEIPGQKYWQTWLNFLKKELYKNGYLTDDDFRLFTIVGSVEAAVKEIASFYRNYHSLRYGREVTILRLNKQIPTKELVRLSAKYRDIINGKIQPSGPLPDEVRNKEFVNLPRICMRFDRKSFGRLTDLIKDLNKV